MSETKQVSAIGTAAILSVFLIQMGITVVTPAMSSFAEHWPDENVTLISTLPSLFIVIGSLVAGAIVGKKFKYRTMAILSSILFLIGGCAPAFFDDFYLTLVCRAVLGLGAGFMMPLGNALILGLYEGDRQAKLLGYGTLFMNLGGILYQTVGGVLCEMDWQFTFYGHLIGVIVLIMSCFLPEPPKAPAEQSSGKKAAKGKINKYIIAAGAVLLFFNILNYPVMLNVSTLFEMEDLGGSSVAAMALNVYTILGCVGGFLFSRIFKLSHRWTLPFSFLLCIVGVALVCFVSNVIVVSVGLGLIGFGFSLILPSMMYWIGITTEPTMTATGTGIAMAMMNIGAFISTYWLVLMEAVFGESVYSTMEVEIVLLIVMMLVFVFYNPFKNESKQQGDSGNGPEGPEPTA